MLLKFAARDVEYLSREIVKDEVFGDNNDVEIFITDFNGEERKMLGNMVDIYVGYG